MDIEKERAAFEESNNVKPDWSFRFDEGLQQYVAIDHEMQLQVDEINEHWDTFRAGWQAAKAQAVPDGFVLVPKKLSDDASDAVWDWMTECVIQTNDDGIGFICCDDLDLDYLYEEMVEAQEQAV